MQLLKSGFFWVLLVVLGAGMLPAERVAAQDIKKVALVSISVNNYKTFGFSPISDELAGENIPKLVKGLESVLAEKYTVVPIDQFVGKTEYEQLAIPAMEEGLVLPIVKEKKMKVFSSDRKELIKGVMTKEQAKKLCQLTGADAVITFYSEWVVATGRFIPTNKALTKNCISMYDKNGEKVFFKRKDVVGDKVLGSVYSKTYINQGTIDQWINASISGTRTIFK